MIDKDKIETAVRMILEAVGEDPEREGLRDTPARVARMYGEILKGTGVDPTSIVRVFTEKEYDEMVLVKDIPLYSLCEHHMLPFVGKAHVAYIPQSGRVTGLSKLIRIVDMYARRLQIQERLTAQIADALEQQLNPMGVMVIIEAEHMCMSMRGVQKPGTSTVTSAVRGIFRTKMATRSEMMDLLVKDK
jgi:GTP cyclohydrolase I